MLDQILFILAGKDNIHKSLDEFEIRPDPIRDHRVSCSLASKKSMLPLFLVSQLCLYLGNSQVSVYSTIGPPVWEVNVSCSRIQHGDLSEDRTPDLSLRRPTLYHYATAPLHIM